MDHLSVFFCWKRLNASKSMEIDQNIHQTMDKLKIIKLKRMASKGAPIQLGLTQKQRISMLMRDQQQV